MNRKLQYGRLSTPPSNLRDFIGEIAPEIGDTFGIEAERHYQNHAHASLSTSITGSGVESWGAVADGRAAALLFAARQHGRTAISFLHTLAPYRQSEAPERLLSTFATAALLPESAAITDYLPLDDADLSRAYERCGFQHTRRQLMAGPASPEEGVAIPRVPVRQAGAEDAEDLARLLVASYQSHSERFLFPEVWTEENARNFLSRMWAGAFGAHASALTLGMWQGNTCVGLVAGSELYPRTGFILHLAVLPPFRGQGFGRFLLNTLRHRMVGFGIDRVLLGVTSDNPATRLYEREGFRLARALPVFHRGVS